MNVEYECPKCGRRYLTPLALSDEPVPGVRQPGPTCTGSRSGGKHDVTVMRRID